MAHSSTPRKFRRLPPEAISRCVEQVRLSLDANHPAEAHAAITELYLLNSAVAITADMPVAMLGLSPRTITILENGGIETVGQLCRKSGLELMALYQIGRKLVEEIEGALVGTPFKLRR